MLSAIKKSTKSKLKSIICGSFFLLAIGDTGHVISRVIAYMNGGVEYSMNLFGSAFAVVGIGRITTSITVTLFYALFLEMWRIRYERKMDKLYLSLQGLNLLRLVIMLFPQNQWGAVVSPVDWVIYRNIPLFIVGLAVIILFFNFATKNNDKTFRKVAIAVSISFLFYTPVILFVSFVPPIGMLMIPKTLAYLYIAVLLYKELFKNNLSK